MEVKRKRGRYHNTRRKKEMRRKKIRKEGEYNGTSGEEWRRMEEMKGERKVSGDKGGNKAEGEDGRRKDTRREREEMRKLNAKKRGRRKGMAEEKRMDGGRGEGRTMREG